MNKNNKLDSLKGTWQTEDEDSRLVLEISEKRGKPHVVAFDKVDGEKFKVTNIQFADGLLCYEVYVPSSKFRARHKLRLISKSTIEQELTFFEKWVRM